MKYSKLFGKTKRKVSGDIKVEGQKLLIQGGFLDQTAAGLYSFLPLGFRVLEKINDIVEQELSKEGVQHILMPYVSPADLWRETGRYDKMDDILAKFHSNRGQDLVLSPTHEEIVTDLVRKYVHSYKDLPITLNQNQLKFRDEVRVFGGLIRTREFLMQDAYSFDIDPEGLEKSFDAVVRSYKSIFQKVNIDPLEVEADSGTMGGSDSHEFILTTGVGEDTVLVCDDCGYKANVEKAEYFRDVKNENEELKAFEIIEQPEWVCTMNDNVKHYKQPLWRFLKNVVYKDEKGQIIIASVRGDQEVNENKLMNVVSAKELSPATEADLTHLETKSGWVPSWGLGGVTYVGDLGLKVVKNFIGGQKGEKTDSANVNYDREFHYDILADITIAKEGCVCAKCKKGLLQEKTGVEVAHAFKLGTCYSESMGAKYIDEQGKENVIHMGCYGLGLSRLVSVVVEANHDENGIIWPKSVAPFQVHIISLSTDTDIITKTAKLYNDLQSNGIEVLWDDREVSAGVKFADADLIGCPVQIIIGKKSLVNESFECKIRNGNEKRNLLYDEIISFVKA